MPSTGIRESGFGHSPTHLGRDLTPFSVEEGHAWLWGVTGEQEWTPNVTTGMVMLLTIINPLYLCKINRLDIPE